jgi:hypothetical protein
MFTATPLNQKGSYEGYKTSLGTTDKFWAKRPFIQNPVIAFVGASVPKQIADEMIALSKDKGTKIVNLCIPSKDINEWMNPLSSVWKQANKTLASLQIAKEDITVVWTMQDDLRDRAAIFPDSPLSLRDKIVKFIEVTEDYFPNVKQIDLASRTYNYLPEGTKHSEPSCYHTGWANRWVVEQFRKRHPVFINDKCYLWTDGNKPNGDLHTSIDQYKEDLVHYSAEGETYWGGKVFDYYSQFLWFV